MDYMQRLEETMKVLDVLSEFLRENGENYIESEDVRQLIKEVFTKIRDIYEEMGDDEMIEEIRDTWNTKSNKSIN
ncbi:MAG: hypothetical protein JW864_14275 [Spirochaetes bacterium]|nr:hypothetical protein [Spirochaetota bacterium]